MFEFFQYFEQWLWYSQIFQMAGNLYQITAYEENALLLFLRRSENSDWILLWWTMEKYILKHK